MPSNHRSLVKLPSRGTAFILGDLHGRLDLFEFVLNASGIEGGSDNILISVGDLIHPGATAEDMSRDDTWKLLDAFIALKEKLPERVFCALGNHEHAQLTDRSVFKGIHDQTANFKKGLEEKREGVEETLERYMEFWSNLPLTLHVDNGLCICHAAPPSPAIRLEELATFNLGDPRQAESLFGDRSPLSSLLWSRYERSPEKSTEEQTRRFLVEVGGRLLVSGHTVPSNGMGVDSVGRNLIVLDSQTDSSGYLEIRLDRPVPDAPTCLRKHFRPFSQ